MNSSSHQSWRKKWEAAPVTPFATALAVIIHWQTELVIIQRQKFINTADKLSLWLYNGKRLLTLTNWTCDYTTAKVYQHCEQTEFVIIQRQTFINTDKPSCDYTTAKLYDHWKTEFVIVRRQRFINTDKLKLSLLVQRQKYINTDKLKLWLYNGKSLSTLRTNRVWLYNGKCLLTLTANCRLSLWLYNGKRLLTLTNWICDYTTAKVYQHCGQTEFVIIQRQMFINTADKLSLWLYNGKSLSTLTNWSCDYIIDYTTGRVYEHR